MPAPEPDPPSRRALLRWGLAAGGAWLAPARADDDVLQESDDAAVSFAYRADATRVDAAKNPTYRAGQTCANCLQYAGEPGKPMGGCGVFFGKVVAAKGWCNAWEKQPS